MEKIHIDLGDKYFQVGANLLVLEKVELILFLVSNLDVFAWSLYEAPRVDPEFICHRLNVDSWCMPKKQKPHRSLDIHTKVVKEEVEKLKEARAIKKVYYLEWLANTIVVKRKNDKWRVCVDFMDPNRACPKDPFLVPKID